MQPFSAPLRDHPQAKQLLENQAAIRQMLANPETQKLLRSLQKKNAGQLKSARSEAVQWKSSRQVCICWIFLTN